MQSVFITFGLHKKFHPYHQWTLHICLFPLCCTSHIILRVVSRLNHVDHKHSGEICFHPWTRTKHQSCNRQFWCSWANSFRPAQCCLVRIGPLAGCLVLRSPSCDLLRIVWSDINWPVACWTWFVAFWLCTADFIVLYFEDKTSLCGVMPCRACPSRLVNSPVSY